ncbi:bifunctional DNA primase/polymerase [Streptomyces sp. NPDC001787]|uniref:bifunctional DNA primase/polymerase n=1 Tax=Streptomyces sp. NPDC001787 TaxID=3154523 RepID=UPI00332AFC05
MTRPPEASAAPPGPSLVDTAIWCAQRGWPVLPLTPGRKVPASNCSRCQREQHTPVGCPCLQAGRWCHGFHAATTDLDRIRKWWGVQPRLGVGVSCGPAQVVVLDVDAHTSKQPQRDRLLPGVSIHPSIDLAGLENGFHTLALLAAYLRQKNPCHDESTLRVETASGGLHIWYMLPHGLQLRSSSGATGAGVTAALAWQVDVRAEKGYVVAPFMRTGKGNYRPLGAARNPAPLPQWLAKELIRTGHGITSSPTDSGRVSRPLNRRTNEPVDGLSRLLDDVRACSMANEGTGFTVKLNKAAFTSGGLVGAGRLSRDDAVERLTQAAESARPNQRNKIARIISDGLTAGARRPLHLEGRS